MTSVPRGQRLVIETVSVFVSLPSGGKAVFVFVQVGNTNFYLPLTSSSANHCTYR